MYLLLKHYVGKIAVLALRPFLYLWTQMFQSNTLSSVMFIYFTYLLACLPFTNFLDLRASVMASPIIMITQIPVMTDKAMIISIGDPAK